MTSSTKPYATLLVLLLGLTATTTSAQVADTLTVTVEGDLAVAEILYDGTPRLGDTIEFIAETLDSEGDPVTAHLTWATSDSTRIRIDPQTGVAVVLAKGTVTIYVLAELVDRLVLGAFRPEEGPATIAFLEEYPMEIGETLQFCAYLLSPGGQLLAHSIGSPGSLCPDAFVEPGYTGARLAMFTPVRVLPWVELAAYRHRLPLLGTEG